MKKLLLFLLISMSINGTSQTDPLSQFFNQNFIPTLVAYDSITVSLDSGSAFSPVGAGYQHYFVNGKIDTLTITQGGMVVAAYQGKSRNSHHYTEVTGYSPLMMDSVDKLIYELDELYRDSALTYLTYDNGSFVPFFRSVTHYDTNGITDIVDIYADLGSGFTKLGDYRFYYSQGNLDSVYYNISPTGQGSGYLKYFYSQSIPGRLLKIETYEDVDNDGELDLVQRLIFKNNTLNQVIEITDLLADNNLNLVLNGAYRYDKRHNSTISLPENSLNLGFYPNPATDFLYLECNSNKPLYCKVLNSQGQLVIEGTFQNRIDVSNLPVGIYQVIVTGNKTGKASFVKK